MTTIQSRPGVRHREVAREAGFGTISLASVVAGTLCAYGAFAIVAAIAGALLSGTDVDLRTDDWTSSGAGAAIASALVLFLSYLFGGYVAGRMARRAGILHGVLVFVLSLVVGAIVGGIASTADGVDVEQNLRSIGVPTTWDQVEDVAIGGAILSLVMILLGSLLGGTLGERWHSKLARRVVDPAYGPAAEERARVETDAVRRREADPLVRDEGESERLRRDADRSDGDVVDVRDRDVAAHDQAAVDARARDLEAREADLAAREEALAHQRGPTDLRS